MMRCNIIVSDGVLETLSLILQTIMLYYLDLATTIGFVLSVIATFLDYFISYREWYTLTNL